MQGHKSHMYTHIHHYRGSREHLYSALLKEVSKAECHAQNRYICNVITSHYEIYHAGNKLQTCQHFTVRSLGLQMMPCIIFLNWHNMMNEFFQIATFPDIVV